MANRTNEWMSNLIPKKIFFLYFLYTRIRERKKQREKKTMGDDYDRFGPKFICNSTCCTIRPTAPAHAYGAVAERFYERAYAAPTIVDDAPRYIPARETRVSGGCLPAAIAPGWIEIGYVYSVRPRPRRRSDDHHHGDYCDDDGDGYGRRGRGRDDIPRYQFAQTPHRSAMPPSRRAHSTPPPRARGGRRRRSWDDYGDDDIAKRRQSGCGTPGCDCGRRHCAADDYDDKAEVHVHHHYYNKGRGSDDCCTPRRYRLFSRPPYPYGCRAYGTSHHYQYGVIDTHNCDSILVTLDPDPIFHGKGGRFGTGFSRRWQELYTGDLIGVPGERGPFRVHLYSDDFNPPPSHHYYDDGYY